MISLIEVANVRIFEGDNWKFNIRPLTVVCGTNGSGKSTILKSLLLLRQSQRIGEDSSVTRGRLRFTGNEVDFGNYELLVSHNDVDKDVSLVVGIDNYMPSSVANELRSYQQQVGGIEVIEETSTPDDTDTKEEDQAVPYSLRAAFTFTYKTTHDSVSDDMPEEDVEHDENGTPVAQVVFE